MSRLAFFVPTLGGGGAERMMLTLAGGFAARGHHVDLLLVRMEGTYLAEVPPSVNLVDLGSRRILTSLPALVGYLRRARPAVVLSTLDTANVVAVCARALAGIATNLVLRQANTPSFTSVKGSKLRLSLLLALMRRTYPRADSIIAISDGVAEDLVRSLGLPQGVVRVIYNPAFSPGFVTSAAEEVRHPWFGLTEPPVVLGVGRLTAQKDYSTLIRAFAIVRRRRPLRLVILGEGEERPRLEALARELGVEQDVALPGFVKNPHKYMARAALFALSSRWEGFGNVLVEALAAGTPVVATNCPGGPAEILGEGRWGDLVPPGSPEAMATALEAALETRCNARHGRRRRQARARAFSLKAALDSYSSVMLGEK